MSGNAKRAKIRIACRFKTSDLSGEPKEKTALLINPPVYDTQYWAEWSQPYGLLRIARLLGNPGYKRRGLFRLYRSQRETRKRRKRETRKRRKRREAGHGVATDCTG